MSFLFRKKHDTSNKSIRAKQIEDVKGHLKTSVWTDPSTFEHTFILAQMPIKASVYIPEDFPTLAPVIRILSPCSHTWIDSNRTLNLCPDILNWSLIGDHSLVALLNRIHSKFSASPPVPDNSSSNYQGNSNYSNNYYSMYGNYGSGQQNPPSQQNSQQPANGQQTAPVTPARPATVLPTQQEKIIIEPVLNSQQEQILSNGSQVNVKPDDFSSMTVEEMEKLHDSLSLVQHYALTHPSIEPLLKLRDELLVSLEESIKANMEIKSEINTISSTTEKEQEELRVLQTKVNNLLHKYKLYQQQYSQDFIASKLQNEVDIADDYSYSMHDQFEERTKVQTGETETQAIQRYLRDYIEVRKRYHIAAARRERVLLTK